MSTLFFLTGNQSKVQEVQRFFGNTYTIKQLPIDVAEIQSLDSKEIIEHKLQEAMKLTPHLPVIVDDTGITFEHYDYLLPGPLVKWFQMGEDKTMHLIKMLEHAPSRKAEITCSIGIAYGPNEIHFFTASIPGEIAAEPSGNRTFGFDPIFIPEGKECTLADMSIEEKNRISHRGKALEYLQTYLLNRS